MNRFLATLQWTPPTVDLEEEVQEIAVAGGNPQTVRLGLEQQIARIEKETGWA